ncbi:hypothetical protein Catovirus_2_271 [Catovirus CTV1]|uniref:Uncharacterized protein n=1 Tax=Catovirus CTV1 TaxID=1977631 RepID=A0A1V0SC88_9VIRU|nr:hypothetical protein Catovirus_2_271 [Catovirus CTV1]
MIKRYEEYYEEKRKIFDIFFNNEKYDLWFEKEDIIHYSSSSYNIVAQYEILGIYDNRTNEWFWSDKLPFVDKSLTKKSMHIRKRISNLKDIAETFGLSSFVIKNIESLIHIMLYYSDENWIIKTVNKFNKNIVEFILIKNILNIY